LTIVSQCYHNCPQLIDNYITMLLQLPRIDWQLYYNVITIAQNGLTIILQLYYNCPPLIDNHITMLLQLPAIDWQLYYNVITIAHNLLTIILHSQFIDNSITTLSQ